MPASSWNCTSTGSRRLLPRSPLLMPMSRRSGGGGVRASAGTTARSHFADTQKYGDVPARKGIARGQFGIFVDPIHCKGCAECVEVCAALGHDALIMIDKVAEEPATGESALDRFERDIRFFRSLPPTPV